MCVNKERAVVAKGSSVADGERRAFGVTVASVATVTFHHHDTTSTVSKHRYPHKELTLNTALLRTSHRQQV